MTGLARGTGRGETESEKAARIWAELAAELKAARSVGVEILQKELDAQHGFRGLKDVLQQGLPKELDAHQGTQKSNDTEGGDIR